MGTHAVQRGATAETVSANVKRLRDDRNLGLRALAKKLGEVGRPLTHSAVDQIEKGTRRVDVDDLLALARALEVSPATLLMPVADEDEGVVVTGHQEKVTARQAWDWITAKRPVWAHVNLEGPDASRMLMWVARSRPWWAMSGNMPAPEVVARGDD